MREERVVKSTVEEGMIVEDIDDQTLMKSIFINRRINVSKDICISEDIYSVEVNDEDKCNDNMSSSSSITFRPDIIKIEVPKMKTFMRCIRPKDEIVKIKSNTNIDFANMKDKYLALIFCNSYEGTHYSLGDCAINDGILSYDWFNNLGYNTFCFHDILSMEAVNILNKAVNSGCKRLAVYFIGHGVNSFDNNGDEEDGKDEFFVFKDRYMRDDDMRKILNSNKDLKELVLMSDCCHSGTIFDVEERFYPGKNVISICAACDHQTAKQDWIERKGNGVFSYYWWKYFERGVESKKI